VLGGSLTPPWIFNLHPWCCTPLGFDKGDDLQMGNVDANEEHKWSLEQLLRTFRKDLHLSLISIYSLSLQFV